MPSPSPLKRWLLLSLVVLLAHLGLLQSMPLALSPGTDVAKPGVTFATRSILLPAAPDALKPTTALGAQAHAKPKTEPKTELMHKPVAMPPDVEQVAQSLTETATANAEPAGPSALTVPAQPPSPAPSAAAHALLPARPPSVATPHDKPARFKSENLSGSTRLIYALKTSKFPFTLSAELLWRNSGQTYSARLRYSAFGLTRLQTSRGQITVRGLAPERFSDKYRSEVAAHFNYPQGKVTFSANTPDATLLPGAQDRLSVLVQLGALVASEPERYRPGSTVTIQTIGARTADLWLFAVGDTVSLDLPGGTLQAMKLERKPRELYDQKVEVWLSPQLNYLPARIRITESNGDSLDQQWASTESADGVD
jgi:hypothetical protein